MVDKTMATLLRLAAMCVAAFVALSFLLFAVDQSEEGSANQVKTVDGVEERAESGAALDRPAPDRSTERLREAEHGAVRELIDDGNDIAVAPFADLVDSSNVWVQRMVAGALAGLIFGLGGMLLANFIPKPKRKTADWREATS
jgi:hypothetical protein